MNGRDQLGERDDNMSVCSAVKKAFTVIDYEGVKKRHFGSDRFVKILLGCCWSASWEDSSSSCLCILLHTGGTRVSGCCPVRICMRTDFTRPLEQILSTLCDSSAVVYVFDGSCCERSRFYVVCF